MYYEYQLPIRCNVVGILICLDLYISVSLCLTILLLRCDQPQKQIVTQSFSRLDYDIMLSYHQNKKVNLLGNDLNYVS